MALEGYESQIELAKYIPDNVVVPLAYGTLENDPSASFFLAIFRDLSETTAQLGQLVDVLEKLHNNSDSPNGKFGFHLESDIQWEEGIRGPDPGFDVIADEFFQKVIPRLLRPLETGGRRIKPSLDHGDLWQGNAQIDMVTQQLVLFDSCCCYAHNECMMREPRYRFTGEHVDRYREVICPSEPVEDVDNRLALYAIHDKLINDGRHDHRAFLRRWVRPVLRLIAKHANGIDGTRDGSK